ncbi:hypothetical protein [Shimia litoralis]|nr:hypothetical protein [Shimia litoralis]
MDQDVLATVGASTPRRWFGVGTMALLGGLLVYLGLAVPPASLGWQIFLLAMGALALWLAEATRKASARTIELTKEGLRDDTGEIIAPIDEIVRVERGTFAMKPSHGFVLRLKTRSAARWRPGLWWVLGKRVGVGGVATGAHTKAMAQILEALLAERT